MSAVAKKTLISGCAYLRRTVRWQPVELAGSQGQQHKLTYVGEEEKKVVERKSG